MGKTIGKNDKTYSEKGSKREASDLRWSGYSVSRYKVKTGSKKGRYRLHISEDKRKRGRKSKSRPKPSGRDRSY